jgi:hypothetical protein
MANQVTMIDAENISVVSGQAVTYNINDLTNQANNITQNITILQAQLNEVNALIAGAQGAGIIIPTLIDQTTALPSGSTVATLLGTPVNVQGA